MRRIIALWIACAAPACAQERWYEMRLSGEPAGYTHSTVSTRSDGGSVLANEMRFVINRLGTRMEMTSASRSADDAEGRLVAVDGETSSSQQSSRYDARVVAGGIELRTSAGGKSYSRTIEVQHPLISGRGVALLCRQKLKRPGDTVTYHQFLAEFGKVAAFTRTLVEESDEGGSRILKIEETNDLMPGKREEWLASDFEMVRSAFDLPFGKIELRLVDKETALRATSGATMKGESYAATLARSNVPLPDPRSIERVKLRLRHRRPDLGWPAFESENQRVIEKTASTLVLEVWRPARKPSQARAADLYLQPNAMLQSDDAEVARIAGEVASGADAFEKVRRLQDWTAQNLKLDLGIAMAPASEVARNRKGTCIAYSVLLASMQRAAGIPSRIAMGYVYTHGIWGGHAWTEAFIDGQWLPFDGAAYGPGIADAARFQFGSYTLEDNLAAATAGGAQTYGNIEVEVLEFTIDGRRTVVPENAKPYTIDGDRYVNPWLGIAFGIPPGFRFAKLDAVYPDRTVVSAEGESGTLTVTLESSTTKAEGTRMPDGNSSYVIRATGPGADRVERGVAESWKWSRAR